MTDRAPWAIVEDCPQRASYVPHKNYDLLGMFDGMTPDERRYAASVLRAGYEKSRELSRLVSTQRLLPYWRESDVNTDKWLNDQAAMRQENTSIRSHLLRGLS